MTGWQPLARFRDPAVPKLDNLRVAERRGLAVPSPTYWARAGDPVPVVRSHLGSDGCAITSTSQSRSVSAVRGWSTFGAITKSRAASAAAARA